MGEKQKTGIGKRRRWERGVVKKEDERLGKGKEIEKGRCEERRRQGLGKERRKREVVKMKWLGKGDKKGRCEERR